MQTKEALPPFSTMPGTGKNQVLHTRDELMGHKKAQNEQKMRRNPIDREEIEGFIIELIPRADRENEDRENEFFRGKAKNLEWFSCPDSANFPTSTTRF